MKATFFILLFFMYTPILLGLIASLAKSQGFTGDSPLSYAAKKIKYSSTDERYIIAIAAYMAFMTPTFIYKRIIDPLSETATTIALILTTLMATASIITIYSSPAVKVFYKKYSYVINLIIATFATINLSRSTTYAEGIITDLIGMRASELPTGLTWISILMTPVAWTITISMCSMAIYCATLSFTLYKEARRNKKIGLCSAPETKTKPSTNVPNGVVIALGFAILTISPISIMSFLLSSPGAEKFIRKELVDASFHATPEECGIRNAKKAKIAHLEAGKALIAIPDGKLGFKFLPIECSKTWKKPEDIEKIILDTEAEKSTNKANTLKDKA